MSSDVLERPTLRELTTLPEGLGDEKMEELDLHPTFSWRSTLLRTVLPGVLFGWGSLQLLTREHSSTFDQVFGGLWALFAVVLVASGLVAVWAHWRLQQARQRHYAAKQVESMLGARRHYGTTTFSPSSVPLEAGKRTAVTLHKDGKEIQVEAGYPDQDSPLTLWQGGQELAP